MKKKKFLIILFILCFSIIVFLIILKNNNLDKNCENNFYLLDLEKNYKICTNEKFEYIYYIYDKKSSIVRKNISEANTLNIKKISNSVLEINEGFGTGIVEKTFYNIEENKFSNTFSYSFANTDKMIAYIKDNNNFIIQNIFDESIYYKEFQSNFPNNNSPIEGYFSNDENELIITYSINEDEFIEKINLYE